MAQEDSLCPGVFLHCVLHPGVHPPHLLFTQSQRLCAEPLRDHRPALHPSDVSGLLPASDTVCDHFPLPAPGPGLPGAEALFFPYRGQCADTGYPCQLEEDCSVLHVRGPSGHLSGHPDVHGGRQPRRNDVRQSAEQPLLGSRDPVDRRLRRHHPGHDDGAFPFRHNNASGLHHSGCAFRNHLGSLHQGHGQTGQQKVLQLRPEQPRQGCPLLQVLRNPVRG